MWHLYEGVIWSSSIYQHNIHSRNVLPSAQFIGWLRYFLCSTGNTLTLHKMHQWLVYAKQKWHTFYVRTVHYMMISITVTTCCLKCIRLTNWINSQMCVKMILSCKLLVFVSTKSPCLEDDITIWSKGMHPFIQFTWCTHKDTHTNIYIYIYIYIYI